MSDPKPAAAPAKPKAAPGAVVLVMASAALMAFLGDWEGARENRAYADKVSKTEPGLPTVCKGLTHHVTTTPIIVGEWWPDEKCEAEEIKAVTMVQRHLKLCFKVQPPQSVFDSFTSHAWNFGVRKTCASGAMLAWNAGDASLACRRLAFTDNGRRNWSSAGGKIVRGLARRREAEMKFCLEDVP